MPFSICRGLHKASDVKDPKWIDASKHVRPENGIAGAKDLRALGATITVRRLSQFIREHDQARTRQWVGFPCQRRIESNEIDVAATERGNATPHSSLELRRCRFFEEAVTRSSLPRAAAAETTRRPGPRMEFDLHWQVRLVRRPITFSVSDTPISLRAAGRSRKTGSKSAIVAVSAMALALK